MFSYSLHIYDKTFPLCFALFLLFILYSLLPLLPTTVSAQLLELFIIHFGLVDKLAPEITGEDKLWQPECRIWVPEKCIITYKRLKGLREKDEVRGHGSLAYAPNFPLDLCL